MSTNLALIGKNIIVYCGSAIFIVGIIGVLFNTLVFISFRTFRQNSCAFYLTIMSMANIGPLCFGLVSRIMTAQWGYDGTESSLFYCKTRLYFTHIFIGTSLTCMCLATIDQHLATCANPYWQQFCKIKLARQIVLISTLFWSLHGVTYLVYLTHVPSISSNLTTCNSTNDVFNQYRIYFVLLVLIGYLPVTIATVFGLLASYNIRHLAYRTVPMVRRELDKQLSIMVLVQILFNIPALLSYTTVSAVTTNPNLFANSKSQAEIQLALNISHMFYYASFASSFYVFVSVSERFRRQFVHVFVKCWKKQLLTGNQIMPEV